MPARYAQISEELREAWDGVLARAEQAERENSDRLVLAREHEMLEQEQARRDIAARHAHRS